MAGSVIDLLENPEIIAEAKAEYARRRNGIPFVSPIPARTKPPVPKK